MKGGCEGLGQGWGWGAGGLMGEEIQLFLQSQLLLLTLLPSHTHTHTQPTLEEAHSVDIVLAMAKIKEESDFQRWRGRYKLYVPLPGCVLLRRPV